jgi:hypothetical protein
MTGSTLASVIIPIVAFLALAVWLTMVFYADAHPMHDSSATRRAQPGHAPERAPGREPEHVSEHAPEPSHPGRKAA